MLCAGVYLPPSKHGTGQTGKRANRQGGQSLGGPTTLRGGEDEDEDGQDELVGVCCVGERGISGLGRVKGG